MLWKQPESIFAYIRGLSGLDGNGNSWGKKHLLETSAGPFGVQQFLLHLMQLISKNLD